MKTTLNLLGFLIALFFLHTTLWGQNLVLNPSFETTTGTCSGMTPGESFSQVVNWDNANSNTPGDSCSSPDLFSPCNTMPIIGGPSPTFAPTSMLGNQCAKSGTKYAGIITNEMGNLGQSYREYIQGKLSSPLQAGQTYCVSFYVSLGDNVNYQTNNIGVYFSNTHYLRDACTQGSRINVTPQLNYACDVIKETNKWMRIQWNYTAIGGESYLIIGNFFTDGNTTIQSTGVNSMNPYAYYFIDDVSVALGACNYAEILKYGANGCDVTIQNPSDPTYTFCISDPAKDLVAVEGTTCPKPATGTWSGPGITNANAGTFNPSVAGVGSHTVTYTTQGGYSTTAIVLVSNCSPITVCKETNGTLTASGGTAPYSWQKQTTSQDCSACMFGCTIPPNCAVNVTSWTNYTTGANTTAPAAYPVQVKDQAGTILVINSLSAIPDCNTSCPTITLTTSNQTNVLCNGGTTGKATVTAAGGQANYTYTWSPGNLTGNTQTTLAAGTYTVAVTDANNCPGSTTVTITEPTALSATATVTQNEDCGQHNGAITSSASGGTSPYSYSWSNGGGTQNISGVSAGNYTVTVTDANNCTATASASVTNTSGLTATATVTQNEDCGQHNGAITSSASGGTSPYAYSWSNGAGTQNISSIGAGNYTVTVTDANNCTATASASVTNTSGLTATATVTQNEDCGQHNGAITSSASGGTSPYAYSWSNGAGTQNISSIGAGNYTVTVTDANNCTATASASVTNQGGFTVQSQITQPTCQSTTGSISLTPSGGTAPYTYTWSNSASGSSISNLAPGNYTVEIKDATGCIENKTYTISSVPIAASIVIIGDTVLCNGQSVTLTASGGVSYTWSTGETSNSITVSPQSTTIIGVEGTDINGCIGKDSTQITVLPTLSAGFTNSPNGGGAPLNVAFTNTSSNSTSYNWNFGNGQTNSTTNSTINVTYDMPGEYTITLIASNGLCTDTTYGTIKVDSFPEIQIHVPNVFTPNGDGINDVYSIETQYAKSVYVEIFNRWGNLMVKLETPIATWDGGKSSDGVYFYKYKIVDYYDKTHEGSGFFHLTRGK